VTGSINSTGDVKTGGGEYEVSLEGTGYKVEQLSQRVELNVIRRLENLEKKVFGAVQP
jgi:hypothetical protein